MESNPDVKTPQSDTKWNQNPNCRTNVITKKQYNLYIHAVREVVTNLSWEY